MAEKKTRRGVYLLPNVLTTFGLFAGFFAIILASKGDIKIADFGTALLSDMDATQISQLVGSPAYMAPELILGEEATCQSDIYALGLLTYRLLTGCELGMKAPSRLDRKIVPAWDDLCEGALEQKLEDRTASCDEFLALDTDKLNEWFDEIVKEVVDD